MGNPFAVNNLPLLYQHDEIIDHIYWPVGGGARELQLSWPIHQDVPAGHILRLKTNGMKMMLFFSVDQMSWRNETAAGKIRIEHRTTEEDLLKNWKFYSQNLFIVSGAADRILPAGTVIKAIGGFFPKVINAPDQRSTTSGNQCMYCLETAPDDDGPWKTISGWHVIETQGADPSAINACFHADGSLHVGYSDGYDNPVSPGERHLTIKNVEGKRIAEITFSGTASSVRISPENFKGINRRDQVLVSDTHGLRTLSTFRPITLDGKGIYFGDLHWHTEFSADAFRSVNAALTCARDQMGLDFSALGDHYPFRKELSAELYLDILDQYNEPDKFATILGYEHSTSQGHFNIYYRDRACAAKFQEFRPEFYRAVRAGAPIHLPLSVFNRYCEKGEAIIIPHHTNATSGEVVNEKGYSQWRQFDWSQADDKLVRLAEIAQTRGSFETEGLDAKWHVLSGLYGASLQSALARGLRFGFVAGSDNHEGWPCRKPNQAGYCAMTAIQADGLSREALFEAMLARRTYATTGARIVMDVLFNDQYPMGSEVKLTPATPRNFHIHLRGTAPIEKIEMISFGSKLADIPTNGTAVVDTVWSDGRFDAPLDNCYYYVRIRQRDGHCAWSSPIWVDYAESEK